MSVPLHVQTGYSKLKLSDKMFEAYFPIKHYINCSNITSNYRKTSVYYIH